MNAEDKTQTEKEKKVCEWASAYAWGWVMLCVLRESDL
jgi:hypothetical protein